MIHFESHYLNKTTVTLNRRKYDLTIFYKQILKYINHNNDIILNDDEKTYLELYHSLVYIKK